MYDNLYNSLSYNLTTDDLEISEKEELMKLIQELDQDKFEIIYFLIMFDWNKNNPNTKVIYPYKLKQMESGIEVKLDCLPIRMKRIILKFCRLNENN